MQKQNTSCKSIEQHYNLISYKTKKKRKDRERELLNGNVCYLSVWSFIKASELNQALPPIMVSISSLPLLSSSSLLLTSLLKINK